MTATDATLSPAELSIADAIQQEVVRMAFAGDPLTTAYYALLKASEQNRGRYTEAETETMDKLLAEALERVTEEARLRYVGRASIRKILGDSA